MSQNLTSNRANVSEENIRLWFKEVETYLQDNKHFDIVSDPSRVFNTDETAFFLNPKGGKVLARRGEKAVYSRSGDEKNV
ncbi:hypothetical protein NQ314_015008 [Rhamnusium bicolor]|uniref:Transposase n=1 Tax=Rhamnusium bicolor TaxID=1586634 RepID=A0AAV8WZH5_9CUCU|nr:hypothetical protein NQ314_015008 [Rhamnusium bicolor]